MKNNKGFSSIAILLGVVVVAGIGYLVYNSSQKANVNNQPASATNAPIAKYDISTQGTVATTGTSAVPIGGGSTCGNVYVVDSQSNNRIQEFTSTGGYVTQWSGIGHNDQYYFDAAVDTSGNVYVVNYRNNNIEKFTSSGTHITQWGTSGSGNGQFNNPDAIAIDSLGNVYVSDSNNNRVEKFDSSGNYITQWGTSGSGNGQFSGPGGIALDSSNNVYVQDVYNFRVEKFTSTGTFITKWGSNGNGNGQFDKVGGIDVDSSGNVYVADTVNKRVQKFKSNGTFITKWGTPGIGNGQFGFPDGIAVDSSGNVYVSDGPTSVSDLSHSRVQEFTSSGTFITKWGTLGSGNGQFSYPYGIAINLCPKIPGTIYQ